MIIAVACDGLAISPFFIQCSSYMCYTIQDGEPIDSHNIPALDQPLDKLPQFFETIGATTLIVGKIDAGVTSMLNAAGIEVVAESSGDPLTAVREYLCESHMTVSPDMAR